MAFSTQIISHPSPGVFEFLRQRVGAVGKKIFAEAEIPFAAVGLVQGKVVDMIAAADVAEKAGNVRVFDLKGICPQHVTMIGKRYGGHTEVSNLFNQLIDPAHAVKYTVFRMYMQMYKLVFCHYLSPCSISF